MIKGVKFASIPVRDQDAALAFPVAALIACAAGWSLVACGDTTGLDLADVAGRYELVEYGGASLPTQTGSHSIIESGTVIECTTYLETGSLDLGTNGRYFLSYTRATRCDDALVSSDTTGEEGSFSVSNDQLRLSFGEFLGGANRTVNRDGDRIIFPEAGTNATRAVFVRLAP